MQMGVKDAFLGKLLASSDKFSDEQVAQTINLLVEHAVKHHASDIHIEPHDRFVQVRYRVDNLLRSTHKLPLAALSAVVKQLKEQAGLKPDEDHLPQEGQYATLVGDEQFEIQVYTMPVIGGEKIVLHVSRRLDKPPTLQQLGFWGEGLQLLQRRLSVSRGLIIVAAPRRNGKTSTLHSMLQAIATPAISIATVEEQIEFRLQGASQTIINPRRGVSAHNALQAALNQDPNVVMLSTIPDRAAAVSVVQAAVAGHLVLAGMPADDAVRAIVQLQSMNEERFLFANALKTVVSQRLVRRLCPECRIFYAPDREEIRSTEKAFGIGTASTKARLHHLEQLAIRAGIGDDTPVTTTDGIVNLWRASDEGCAACNHTGYQGALAIVEVLSTQDNAAETALLSTVQAEKLRAAALKDGFIPMELDGLIKALRGQTTLTELLRVLAVAV